MPINIVWFKTDLGFTGQFEQYEINRLRFGGIR